MGLLDLFCRTTDTRKTLEQKRARLYRLAYAWCHNAALADDLVQDTLTKALQKAGQLRDQNAQDAWLFSILANCYRDHFRRTRDMDDIDDVELSHDLSPETETMRDQVVDRVRAAIARLPEGQRQVVTLVDLEGFSYVEVAQILQIPSGTVMSRLCRARAALKTMLFDELQQQKATKGMLIRRIK
jgi:RNA polymerase sigma-70 factor (ECF subfamily)